MSGDRIPTMCTLHIYHNKYHMHVIGLVNENNVKTETLLHL